MVALGRLHNSPGHSVSPWRKPGYWITSHGIDPCVRTKWKCLKPHRPHTKVRNGSYSFLPPFSSSHTGPPPHPISLSLNGLLDPASHTSCDLHSAPLGACSTCEEINVSFMHEEAASLPLGWLTHTQQAPGGNMATVSTEHVCEAREEGKGGGGGKT